MTQRKHLRQHAAEGQAEHGRSTFAVARDRRMDVLDVVVERRTFVGRLRTSVTAQIDGEHAMRARRRGWQRLPEAVVEPNGMQEHEVAPGAGHFAVKRHAPSPSNTCSSTKKR